MSSQRLGTAASGSGPWCGCRGVSPRIGFQKGQFADKYAIRSLILPFSAIWGYPWEPGIAKEAHRSTKKRLGIDFWRPFWLPFWAHFGSMLAPVSGSFFDTFLGALLERPWVVFSQIWDQFRFNFGSILGLFWETLRKVKIELSLKRQPHFHCP